MPTQIVKVGGSLLDWPLLPSALECWLANQPPAVQVLIAGGGALANAIREADQRFSLSPETSHWLCVDGMSITARILAAILPRSAFVATFSDLQAFLANTATGIAVLELREFLRDHEPHVPGEKLPCDWSVSSDSIAARLGSVLKAEELVLLKSADPPASTDAWAREGFVDSHFPIASKNLPVRAVNLRHA
jgi:5-(aminomethyl)-3-furanmethanol phosphate kinase